MKKLVSLLLTCCMLTTVVYADEIGGDTNTTGVTITCSGDTEFSTEEVTSTNYLSLSSISSIKVEGDFTHYNISSSDEDTATYMLDGIKLEEIDYTTNITSEDAYVHTKKPGKSTINVVAFKDKAIVGSETFEIECKVTDDRDKVAPTKIKVGGVDIDGYSPDINNYTVNVESLDANTTVTVEVEPKDDYEIIQDKNTTYIVVFNKDKSKSNIYSVEFKYDFINTFGVSIQENIETNSLLEYTCSYNGNNINSLVNVELPYDSGFVESNGRIHTIKSGLTTIKFSIGNVVVEKTVNITGDTVIDVPQYTFTLDSVNKFVTGDIYKTSYSSDVFANDTRYTIASTNNDVVRVIGKNVVVLNPGDVTVKSEHLMKGLLDNKVTTAVAYKDTKLEIMPEVDNVNILVGESELLDCKIADVYNRTLKIEIVSGDSVELHGNAVLGVKRGRSTVKISSGNAERVIEVNVLNTDVIIPTDIKIENKSSDFVINKESIFEVQVLPEGATLSTTDISVSSNKQAKIRSLGDLKYGITPEESGEHTITVRASLYSMENSILVKVKEDGEVINPDVPGASVDVEKIVLEDTYISLEVGDRKTIRVKTITPASATNKEVRYESMNTRYATVDNNGRVTGERAGTAKINVYSVSNPEVYATCTINVYDEDDRYDSDDKYRYPVDKVVIYREDNGKEVAIRNGKTDVMVSTEQQFVARIYPYNATNQEVRWYTSNSNIAEVDEDGMLTAYRVGEVELRVVTRDGNHRDSIKVEITEWMLKPTSIKIVNVDNSEVNTEVKTGDKLALKVNFEPLLTTERDVIWTITEGFHLFTLSKTGDVEFKEVGKATIKVYTKDYSTYTTLTFNITYSDDYWKDIGSTKNMSPRKAIEVKFSEALSISNIQNGNIFVATTRDGNTKAENVLMELVDGNRVLRVSSLSGEWEPEKTYYLLIKGASKSESGIQLIKNCRYTFETRKGRQSAK